MVEVTARIKYSINAKPLSKINDSASGYDMFANLKDSTTLKYIDRYNTEYEKPILYDDIEGYFIEVNPLETMFIPSGAKVEIPEGYEGHILNRSGKSAKERKVMANCTGLIDCDYRGDLTMPIINLSQNSYIIKHHEKLAQFVIKEKIEINWIVVEELSDTERGNKGFGSSDLKN